MPRGSQVVTVKAWLFCNVFQEKLVNANVRYTLRDFTFLSREYEISKERRCYG
jgi:hypothetical protein